MKNYNLTELEKETLKDALYEGYIYDATYDKDAKSNFLCWGFSGSRERGAVASLVKKGIISIDYIDGDTYVYLDIPREEAERISGAKSLA